MKRKSLLERGDFGLIRLKYTAIYIITMKIFRKVHFWKDSRTFIEAEASEPKLERGFAKEGSVLIKIGEQSFTKSAFKLNVDEARALRDALDMFLRFHDMKLSEMMSGQPQESHSYQEEQKQDSIFLFSEDNEEEKQEEKNEDENPTPEFYF